MIPVPDHGFPELYQYLWKFIIIFVCRSLLAMLYIYQNTLWEKELLRACTDGDLETVNRLSSRIAVRNVHDHQFDNEDGPLHKPARYDIMFMCVNVTLYP